ncbi:toxin extrusion protein 1 [Seminavis robusta]|uniref:Toxin extrusion protein 1 n=1 Tax=Seminavis robusta TaxID=568900 RepID=A0A9N8E3R0_9STRA|nr:toxin extrusion protein 1 [Seminavis robusta]|eukprot:Sro514_g158000.1 toxin extrusion protein 1 (562) ;mRNA; r:16462-18147
MGSERNSHHDEVLVEAEIITNDIISNDQQDDEKAPLNHANTNTERRDPSPLSCRSMNSQCSILSIRSVDWQKTQQEAILLLDLAIPQTFLQLGLIWASALTASYVGRRMGSIYLDGFTLGNLTGNLFISSLLQGILSASDTLSPQAFGAGNDREVGLLAIRGFVVSLVVTVPILVVLFSSLERIFQQLHQDPLVAELAKTWFQVFSLGLPFYSLSMMMWRFLAAQGLMMPQVIVGAIANLVVLPLCLELCIKWFDFIGSAIAITSFSIVHTAMLWFYLWRYQPHSRASWPGLSRDVWKEALAWEPLVHFVRLGLGGMLCSCEWIYWEILVLMAGSLGVVPLSAQTIANMVVEVFFMLPIGVGIGLTIRIGATLSVSVARAQVLAMASLFFGTIAFALLSMVVYYQQNLIVSFFTVEPDVIEACRAIWWKVALLNFNCGIYGIVTGIATGLGMQWTLGIASLVALVVLGLPLAYYFAIVQGGGLSAIWFWMNPPYALVSFILLICFTKVDWNAIAADIMQRERSGDDHRNKDPEQPNVTMNGYGSTDHHQMVTDVGTAASQA